MPTERDFDYDERNEVLAAFPHTCHCGAECVTEAEQELDACAAHLAVEIRDLLRQSGCQRVRYGHSFAAMERIAATHNIPDARPWAVFATKHPNALAPALALAVELERAS